MVLLALIMIWAAVALFLWMLKPMYICKWTLILPGTGLGSLVALENVGQTSTSVNSSYSNTAIDPKVNYKTIVQSKPVLMAAAQALQMPVEEFGEPQIKLVDQTSFIQLTVKGRSAEQAYHKAVALNEALQERLEQLRLDEVQRRSESVQMLVQDAREKLETVQQHLATYQADSKLTSLDQLKELMLTVEQLRKEQALQQARQRYADKRVAQFITSLNISPRLAAEALTLQADPIFQQHLTAYAAAESKLAEHLGKWGVRHPEVMTMQKHVQQASAVMLRRGETLLGHPVQDLKGLSQLLLSHTKDDKRSQLFQELITAEADKQGVTAQLQSLQQSLVDLEKRLQQNNKIAAGLSDLQNKHQVATVIFTSILARLDIGKSDPFASYPLVQVLAAPMLPEKPDPLYRLFALLGGAVASLCVLIGAILLWYRQTLLRKTMKNA